MNQLKFVRSKSTTRHSPLRRTQQSLKQVNKPGKPNVSVGKSRPSSINKEISHVFTPKEKVEKILNLLQMHQKKEKLQLLLTPDRKKSFVPLSHEKRYGNESTKNFDQYQIQGVVRDNNTKKLLDMQALSSSHQIQESTITEKLDAFQLRLMKLNTPDQTTQDQQSPTTTLYGTPMESNVHFPKDILKQSSILNNLQSPISQLQKSNQQSLHQRPLSNNQTKMQKENQFGTPKLDYNIYSPQSEYQEIYLEINPAFIDQCRKNAIVKKPILEQTEEEECTKQSTKSPQKQGQIYSELYTEKSLILVSPKTVKDMEMQTSFQQAVKEAVQINQNTSTQSETANAQCQTKFKKKNLGLFQYQISYLSPQNYRNQQEIDLLSLEDFQSQILYQTQSEFDKDSSSAIKLNYDESFHKKQQIIKKTQKEFQLQSDSRSYLLSQKSNIYLSKEQLLDPQDDSQPYYLQAEPKEINHQIGRKQCAESTSHDSFKRNSSLNFSKSKKGVATSINSSQCYKDHLNLLLTSSIHSNTRLSPHAYLEENSANKSKQQFPLRSLQSQCKSRKNSKQKILKTRK